MCVCGFDSTTHQQLNYSSEMHTSPAQSARKRDCLRTTTSCSTISRGITSCATDRSVWRRNSLSLGVRWSFRTTKFKCTRTKMRARSISTRGPQLHVDLSEVCLTKVLPKRMTDQLLVRLEVHSLLKGGADVHAVARALVSLPHILSI